MAVNKQQFGTPFQASAAGSTSAIAFKAAVAGRTYYVTDYTFSSDKSQALAQILDGVTPMWRIGSVGAVATNKGFQNPLTGTSGASVVGVTDGTAGCWANIAGFYLE